MATNPTPCAWEMRKHALQTHPRCVVCSTVATGGLQLQFEVRNDGSVCAVFDCRDGAEGYSGIVHGGILSLLLDGAMTNCLFAHGVAALTAELTVRFRERVLLGRPATVAARLVKQTGAGFALEGTITQDNRIKVIGRALFLKAPAADAHETET